MRFRFPSIAPVAALMLGLLTSGVAALAQGDGPPRQVSLTPAQVEGFLASYGELEELGETFEREYGDVEADPQDPTATFLGYARHADAKARMEEILERHGMGTLEEWTATAYSVMIAYSFAERSEDGLTIDDEMDEAIAQIENDAGITAEQKAQMIEMLNRQREALSALRPSPENVEVVRPFMERIRAVVDD